MSFAAFGAHDGVGLYPFNPDSLINMFRRLNDTRFDQQVQSQELLVKDVLAEVLGTYGDDLKKWPFPVPNSFLNQMQGASATARCPVTELRQQNSEQADRQLAILELWGKGNVQPTSGLG